ncbi:MAG: hypothetical protein IPL61_03840 [Myxococcales bacterium]|nr:hypothetical protein [Myxococcales bacterium]
MRKLGFAMVVTLLAACGGESSSPAIDAAVAVDALPRDWVVLIAQDWTLPAGTENMVSSSRILDQDLYVRAIRPLAPAGTHHTLLGLATGSGGGPGTSPDGLIYASGVGTDALMMPPGVGLRLEAGKQLTLQLHLYNTGDAPLSGTSGIEVLLTTADQIADLAEIELAGPLGLTIPPGVHTISGTCTATSPQTVFAIFPHMHQLGTHFRAEARTAAGAVTIHDDRYSFDEQRISPITPLPLAPGDTITTDCTWDNTTGATVTFGTSSDAEMCFSILFRYPATGGGYCGA